MLLLQRTIATNGTSKSTFMLTGDLIETEKYRTQLETISRLSQVAVNHQDLLDQADFQI